jgi:hypothetical protein
MVMLRCGGNAEAVPNSVLLYFPVEPPGGKVLVFFTLASFLLLSARNFNAHRHNSIINKHRQNSLVTYEALVKAAGAEANRDIVLTKAAESIFNQQSTGFTKADGNDGGGLNVVSLGTSFLKPPGGTS